MLYDFEQIEQEARAQIQAACDLKDLDACRIKYLGRKGVIQGIYGAFGNLSNEEKPIVGKKANALRDLVISLIEEKKNRLQEELRQKNQRNIDVTLPGTGFPVGRKHILTQTMEDICGLFEKLGFVIQDGPEIETEKHNFEGLNIPADHPSRDGFDTFYLDQKEAGGKDKPNLLLRSHTSPGQIRIMSENEPPLAVVIPGRVYRPDAVDASHSFMFHQIEGLLVDKDVKFSDLKGLLTAFCQRFFSDDVKLRFRPHFFPFTEPSAEVDISWRGGKKDWLEIMGCGMVHPNVFSAVGYPKGKYTGLAFGLGVERIAMLKHGIDDIRLFYENDQRFLKQF